MEVTSNIENVSITLPDSDLSFLRTLAKKMGWSLKKQRKSGIDKALDDVNAGRVHEAKSFEDLLQQLNS